MIFLYMLSLPFSPPRTCSSPRPRSPPPPSPCSARTRAGRRCSPTVASSARRTSAVSSRRPCRAGRRRRPPEVRACAVVLQCAYISSECCDFEWTLICFQSNMVLPRSRAHTCGYSARAVHLSLYFLLPNLTHARPCAYSQRARPPLCAAIVRRRPPIRRASRVRPSGRSTRCSCGMCARAGCGGCAGWPPRWRQ